MPTCVAFGCSNRAPRKGITFHKIPKDEFIRHQWILAIRRKDWTPTKWSRICSDHFHPDDLDRTSVSSTRIRENAVPSIFPAFPAYLQKALEKRRILQKRIIQSSSGKFDNETPGKKENESPLMLMSRASLADDTAEKMIAQLQRKLDEAEKRSEEYKKKIKTLQQTNRRYTKRNSQLSSEIAKLKRNKVASEDGLDIAIISPDVSEPVVSEALLALQMSECPETPVSKE